MTIPANHFSPIKPLSPNYRIGLRVLSFSLVSTFQSIALAADSHIRDDAFWAEAARLLPAFELPQDIASHDPDENDEFGKWGPVLAWPHIPVSGATLPDGRVLTWASNKRIAFPNGQSEFTYAATWDPTTGQFVEINHESHDMFCAAQVMLENGNLFVSGGRNESDSPWTSIFDYQTSTWVPLENMNAGRWYNTSVAMPDGTVFTAAGTGGGQYPEIWTSDTGWDLLTGIDLSGPILSYTDHGEQLWWPLLNLAPNGEIFHAGPTPKMHYMNPADNGTITQVGPDITDWYPKHGTTVMYDEGKLLVAGGWTSGGNPASTNQAMIIDINGPTPVMTTISPMTYARKYHNGVILPNGEVLVVGGNTSGAKFNDTGTILAPEIWNPDTEQWREVADMSVPRNYHSIAFLLTDGTVLSAGGGLCNCAADHQDGQVYSPPYLFNPDGTLATRPVISSGPSSVRNGTVFDVVADPGIQQFSLIRMSSSTHAINTDLRYLNVPFVEIESGQYELTAHNNINVLSPGFWMLFALNAQGIPSVAFVLQVTTEGLPTITDPASQFSAEDDTVSLPIQATDDDPLNYSATGLPPGLTIDPVTGVISGTLPVGSSGIYSVTVSVADDLDTVSTMFVWSISVDGTGQILREWWTDIPGSNISDLTGDSNYPDNPTGTDLLTLFEAPSDWADDYGTRVRGYIHPITSGDYTFWIASDDQSELWLSTDEFPSNAVLIANVPTWSDPRQWTKFPEQQSTTISLQAGRRYYIEALQKEDGGLDHLAVAWEGPDLSQQVIDGVFLSSYSGAPLLTDPGDQIHIIDETINLAIRAFDPDGDPLVFSATGLPSGLGINSGTGLISGAPTIDGVFNVMVSVSDGNGGADSIEFTWTIGIPLVIDPIVAPPQTKGDSIIYTANFTGGTNPQFTWLLGDGTPETAPSSSPTITHSFTNAQRYVVKVTGTSDSGEEVIVTFVQAIHEPITPTPPAASMSVVYEERTGNDRVWNVNPDNDTVSVFDTVTADKIVEIPVDAGPRSLAIAPDGRLWVVNKHAATVSILDTNTLSVVQTLPLAHGSQPFGVVFDNLGGHAYVTLEATGLLQRFDAVSGASTGNVDVGPNPRHLSVNGSGSRVFISRFISPLLPDEATTSPQTEIDGTKFGGEVVVVDTTSMTVTTNIVLQHSNAVDSEHEARGIPNYLGPAVVSPDGLSAWVASKQDNIKRGTARDGLPLTHDSTLRSITSRIDLTNDTEDYPDRVDHDNGGVASSALFGRFGSYLFVTLEGSREVAVIDPYAAVEIHRFDSGLAPQGLALSPDGLTLYVHNFMERTITVHDISDIVNAGGISVPIVATFDLVASETLSPQVLLGKQLFYDARDPRLGFENYISCAACHDDGGLDGRVWDFTNLGEGFRETVNLRGRAGLGHGSLHWSGNFDEVQDFEGQIRSLSKGTGLMTDTDFFAGTRSDPLGDPKTGLSGDLDALAAYVTSLDTFSESPHRDADGTLTADGVAGKAIFEAISCSQCHSGQGFTDSALDNFHNIGTIKPTSGSRLGQPLTGLDTPTLRGLFNSAPYLHDGSAANLEEAVTAHAGVALSSDDLRKLVSFLQQIDGQEPAANTPPSLVNPGDQSTTVHNLVSLSLTSTDPDIGDTMSFSATGLPEGLSINGISGEIFGISTVTGPHTVTATVSDNQGTSSSVTFLWTITGTVNQPPVLTSPGDQSDQEGELVDLLVTANDPDRNSLTFDATGLPADLSIDNLSGLISGTLSFTSAGSYDVNVIVNDGIDSDSVSFFWTVGDVNQPPFPTAPDHQSNQEGDVVNLLVTATDVDGDPLTFSATNLPHGLSIDSGSGLISGTLSPFSASDGSHNVIITVSAGTHTINTSFLWTVFNVNQPPILISPGDQSNQEGDIVTVTVAASDADGDRLTFLATGLPSGLSINPKSGLISGTLPAGTSGSYIITMTVLDTTDTISDSFLWRVTGKPLNQPPIVEDPSDQFNAEGESVNLAINATDADGQQLAFEATGLPEGLRIDTRSGLISGTLAFSNAESNEVTVTVTDGADTDSVTFLWNVANVNQPPILAAPGNQSHQEGDTVSLQVTANDVDGDPLTFDVASLPSGLSMDSGSGLISGTLSFTSAGFHNVTVTVSAGPDIVAASFLWNVSNVNQPPVLTTPDDQSNQEADVVNLPVTANDADGGTLTFDAIGLPEGLSIDKTLGVIVGNLSFTSEGLHDVLITVSDGIDSDSGSFIWTVADSDQPPNIDITPINLGIAAQEEATGSGYILYSEENVHTRFSANPPHPDNSDHLISVRFVGERWHYNNSSRFFPFTPRSTDILIADVDFDADTIVSLQGIAGTTNGIRMGYVAGDLSFQANWWNNTPNTGDFTVEGTQFVPNGIPPNIDIQPADLTVTQSQQAVFAVLASGDEPIAYQWQRDGVDLPGETSSAYLLESTDQLTDNGAAFDVIVSNPRGTTTSVVATLTVNLTPIPPTVEIQPMDQTVIEPSPALFSVKASGNAPLSYQWRRNGIHILGATRANYQLEPTDATSHDSVVFDVVISSPFGTVISLPAVLHVDPAPIYVFQNNSGIAARDLATGTGYILYSEENVHTRFSANRPFGNTSAHWIAVQFDGTQWLYDNNSRLFPFAPQPTDILVALVDFDADTISGLQGVSGTDHGIRLGYASGDLTFQANWWNGSSQCRRIHREWYSVCS